MSPGGVFVTGTDTGCGKTRVSAGLLRGWRRCGYRVAGMKPVASGCERRAGELFNADALALQAAAGAAFDYVTVNPYALEPAIAPHVAARQAGIEIRAAVIKQACEQLATASERLVVEGVGGWRVPLAVTLQTADLVRLLNMPVLLVVGFRLGCISHALLTAEAIRADGLTLLGWVANRVEADYAASTATLDTLRASIPAPLLGDIAYAADDGSEACVSLAKAVDAAMNLS